MSRTRSSAKLRAGILLALVLSTGAHADAPAQLRDYCPPGFELADGNRCELRTLYQNYDSQHYAGVGGPRTGLPGARDGLAVRASAPGA